MGLIRSFTRLFEGKSAATEVKAASPSPFTLTTWPNDAFGSVGTIAGPSIGPQSAMRVPAVAAAVGLISETVGALPVKVFATLDTGSKEADPSHPAHRLVHGDANPWQSASALRTALTADALLHGNGFAFAVRVDSRVVEFVRLDPGAVTVEIDDTTGEPVYRVRAGRSTQVYSYRDILHIAAPHAPDGIIGVAPITLAREAIALALVLEQHAARLFGRGARPSGALKIPGKLTADALTRIAMSWEGAHGAGKSGGTAILEDGAEWQPIVLTSVDAQFAEMRAFQLGEIARAFRVPPVFLMDYGRATWGNAEQMGRQLVDYTLAPWLAAWEAAYRRVLLTDADRDTFSIEFVPDALLQADTATRAEALLKFRSAGIMTANEARRLENLPALPGGDSLGNPFTTAGSGPTEPATTNETAP